MESKINVSVRIKPLSSNENAQEKNHLWKQVSDNTLMNQRTKEMFSYDSVFGDKISTQEIFDTQVKEFVHTALSGINMTVFAYGQTSSGKTFTMRGYKNKQSTGLIDLSIDEIFNHVNQDSTTEYKFTISYMEIYNEMINDLINPANKNLDLRESISKGIYINKLEEVQATNARQILDYMDKGDVIKNIAETKMNETSSRSHSVFRINIQSQKKGETTFKLSQLNLVDLAGSEGASKTNAEGVRLREGSNINRSLLALSNVINKLSQSGKSFINYRDSKLTRILQTALGGNSKTAIICTMTQTLSSYQETVNTLHFGQKAKHVKTTINVNEISASESSPELDKAQSMIRELKVKLKQQEDQFNATISKLQKTQQDITNESQADLNQLTINASHDANEDQSRMSISAKAKAIAQSQEITQQFLRDQLSFMQDKVQSATKELEEKESLIQQIASEKREYIRKFDTLELQNFKLQESLACIETEKDSLIKEKMNLSQRVMDLSAKKGILDQSPTKDQDGNMLEADGIKCFDLAQNLEAPWEMDLRMSLNAKALPPSKQQNVSKDQSLGSELRLLSELEKTKQERDELRYNLERTKKDQLNQTLENNIDIREENQLLKEEQVQKDEQIQKLEKEAQKLQDEVQFYKQQNLDLIKRLDEIEHNCLQDDDQSVTIMNESQMETQRLLKEQNESQLGQISNLKIELKEIEMNKSKAECFRAELEHNLRAAEYNVEILKNKLENIGTEMQLLKMENDKQKQSISLLKSSRQRGDQSSRMKPSKLLKKRKRTSNGDASSQNLLDSSRFDATPQQSMRLSLCPSDMGPFMVDTSTTEVQCDIVNISEYQEREQRIKELQKEFEIKQGKIDELEKRLDQANNKAASNDMIKKFKFDNQILMQKLSEYKKAERCAKDIVTDYEQMKLKYFNVLTENEKQKNQISELYQSNLSKDVSLNELNDEREQNINELYLVRMDVNKKINDLDIKNKQLEQLQARFDKSMEKAAKLVEKERELARLQGEVENYLNMLKQVDKHLKTLVKYLKSCVNKTTDPTLIETTQRQIKSIEKLHQDVQDSIRSKNKLSNQQALESLFLLSASSIQSNSERQSLQISSPPLKINNKSNKQQKGCVSLTEISLNAGQKVSKRMKISEFDNGYISKGTNMIQTTDADSLISSARHVKENNHHGLPSSELLTQTIGDDSSQYRRKRSGKQSDKAFNATYNKTLANNDNPRRSGRQRIKNNGHMTESDF